MSSFAQHNDPDLFRESVNYTAASTKFLERLIEKDYFCSLALEYFSTIPDLVFKGGACLAKVHANFYRLSEDLDFTISTPIDASRNLLRQKIEPVKKAFGALGKTLPSIRVKDPLVGRNSSTQYIATLEYTSLITGNAETIKFEVSLREPLLDKVVKYDAHTILLSPITTTRACKSIQIPCIAKREAYAEKFRAALTRREPAIRDLFDLDFVLLNDGLKINDPELIKIIKQKLIVPGNMKIDISDGRFAELQKQIETQLKPVLREKDFNAFEQKRAFDIVRNMASKLA